jgi:hypothetical protein
MYLLLFAVPSHETLVSDVGEEKSLVDDNVDGIPSEEESVELSSESHSRPMCASPPFFCSTSSSPSCLRPCDFH